MQAPQIGPWAQFLVAVAAFIGAIAYGWYVINSLDEERNAALVKIGVDVLRADPEKESQVRAAREWALNLIDANTGGVKFSAEAREQLLGKRLGYGYNAGYDYGYDFSPGQAVGTPLPPQISK
jgi:hypothetical protein